MPYTHFRFLAYEVPTVTYKTRIRVDGISGWSPGAECAPVGRIAVPDSVTEADSRIRLRRLAAVVSNTYNWLQLLADDNGNTLKIFVAPEFYFRPPVIDESYKNNTYPDHVAGKIFKALNTMFAHADFHDWLFVCGTVMWNRGINFESQPLYFNTAVHVRGGPRLNSFRAQDAVGLVEKQLASDIDGVPVAFSTGGEHSDVKLVFEDWATRKNHVFSVDGTPLGLEVCLDHLNHDTCRVLKRVLADWPSKEMTHQEVKLHVLTAGGMDIQPASVAAKVGGYVLRNDGMASGTPDPVSELKRVDSYDVQDPLFGLLAGQNSFDPSEDTTANTTNIPAENTHPLSGKMLVPEAGTGYKTFTQKVSVYPVQAMPA